MRAAGLCHTDVTQVRDARFTPILLGHEGAGEIESVGEGVTGLAVGDRVLVCWKVPCGRCRRCLADVPHLCEAVVGLSEARYLRGGEPVGPMLNAGCFCDHVVLPADGAVRIVPDLPLDQAALVGCGVATGVGAALWTAEVERGASVAVFGAGGVGLNVVVGARMAGASTIVAVDPDADRRARARPWCDGCARARRAVRPGRLRLRGRRGAGRDGASARRTCARRRAGPRRWRLSRRAAVLPAAGVPVEAAAHHRMHLRLAPARGGISRGSSRGRPRGRSRSAT